MFNLRVFLALCLFSLVSVCPLFASNLTIQFKGDYEAVSFVGAIYRWDPDGLPKQADGSARVAKERAEAPKIDEPWVDFKAVNKGNGKWMIDQAMPAGDYDLIVIKRGVQQRFEGWRYAPVLDFEEFFPPDAGVFCDKEVKDKIEKVDDEESFQFVDKQIRTSKHYENKVIPLYFGGSYKKGQVRPKQIRVLVMLIRDQGTTLDSGSATMRFEIWQFEDRSGGYVKQKRTHVLHRLIMPRNELCQWTWLWDPALGNVHIKKSGSTEIEYTIPNPQQETKLNGLMPYTP
ncbi:hypothetical protein FACS189427_05520 [Planctomycetales bacterium]|nr:hypothetical protein FACS189427_05520 [Planctomycetales bacterium]